MEDAEEAAQGAAPPDDGRHQPAADFAPDLDYVLMNPAQGVAFTITPRHPAMRR